LIKHAFVIIVQKWSLVRSMWFDSTASNIGRKSAACDDSNQVWARFCCAWHVYDVVVGELFTHVLWSVIWVLHWLIQFHGYWLQNDRCQFHTANVYVEVLM